MAWASWAGLKIGSTSITWEASNRFSPLEPELYGSNRTVMPVSSLKQVTFRCRTKKRCIPKIYSNLHIALQPFSHIYKMDHDIDVWERTGGGGRRERKRKRKEGQVVIRQNPFLRQPLKSNKSGLERGVLPVSYTHLTLPTKLSV